MLGHREQLVYGRHLRYVAQAALGLNALVRLSADENIALEAQKAGNAFYDRALAGAVGAQQHGRLAGVDSEADVTVGHVLAVALGHMLHAQKFVRHSYLQCLVFRGGLIIHGRYVYGKQIRVKLRFARIDIQ